MSVKAETENIVPTADQGWIKMKLTKEEDKICRQYGEPDADGRAHCEECPLVLDTRYCLCKANCTEEEWAERKND
jgi:hypothetical protein